MNMLRWVCMACLITIFFAGQAFAQGNNQQITLEVPVQLNNMHEEALKIRVSSHIYAPAPEGEELGEILGYGETFVDIPTDGNLSTKVEVVVTPNEGKDFNNAAVYRAGFTVGYLSPIQSNPDRIMYLDPSYDSHQDASTAKAGTSLVKMVEGTID